MAMHPTSRIARIMDSLGDAAVASARRAVVVIGSLIVAVAAVAATATALLPLPCR
jgi:hypothetical protein